MWLDRGELDKIIDRAAADSPAPATQQYQEPRYDNRSGYAQQPYRKKKKENWLSDLFD